MSSRMDLTGKVFGRLTVIEFAGYTTHTKQKKPLWRCVCKCGNEKITDGYLLNKGESRSCGCLWKEQLAINRSKINYEKNNTRLPGDQAAFNLVYRKYKKGARERGLSFDLDESLFRRLISAQCHYCGVEPSHVTITPTQYDPRSITHNGIDRMDSTQGYNATNCVPCCTSCNILKKAMPYDEFVERVIAIINHIGKY